MKKIILILALLAGLYYSLDEPGSPTQQASFDPSISTPGPTPSSTSITQSGDAILSRALAERRSNLQVTGSGTVIRVLADDNDGSRHQRFILRLDSGQTLLVAHNIDLAARVSNIQTGDQVSFNGVYEWNAEGGVIHWTHHDPAGRHEAGWLGHAGKIYQ